MSRTLILAAAALLCACGQSQNETASLPACEQLDLSSGALNAEECQIQAGGQVLHVRFEPLAAGAVTGAVSIDVIGEDGTVVQNMLEPEVAEYRAPTVEDIDGDGRADLRIPRLTGNVNTESALWIYSGERGAYQRVGTVSGVSIARTADGYVAVPARSSADVWNVAFYRLDEGGLQPLVTIEIAAPDTCTIAEAPGLRDLNLTEQAARAKFCAEPAAGVFEP